MTTRSKSRSSSARRSSPRTHSKSVSKPNSSPITPSGAMLEPTTSPRTCSGAVRKPNSSPGTNGLPRTPYTFGAITPIGTLKSVSLSDWWLRKKGKEKGLCITGFESKGGSEVRLFSSGTISKRHDSITLETFDGVTICISGFINRLRSLQNGVSSEVCNRFLLGFPYNWKDYEEEEEEEESMENKKKKIHTDFNISFDDIPVNRLQDLSLLEGSLKGKIFDDVIDSLRDFTCHSTQKSDKKCEKSRTDDEGVKTRGMLRRREDDETSIGKRVHKSSRKKKKVRNFY